MLRKLAYAFENHECVNKVLSGLENGLYYNLYKKPNEEFHWYAFIRNWQKHKQRKFFEKQSESNSTAISLAGVESTINIPFLTT